MKNFTCLFIIGMFALTSCQTEILKLSLHETDLTFIETGWGNVHKNFSVDSNRLQVAGKVYENGVGTHAISRMLIDLHGTGKRISGYCGVDDESGDPATIEFFILGDAQVLWQSGIMTKGDSAGKFDVVLDGIQKLGLYVSDGGDNINYDHADWLEVAIEYTGREPVPVMQPMPEAYILTPPPPDEPRINGPVVYGATPGKPFLFKIPATGKRPMTFAAEVLPEGLILDPATGIISGTCPPKGDYEITFTAKNELGSTSRSWKLVSGGPLALTPPMGWNSWNCWGLSVDQEKVKAAAEAMVASGLADHGWSFINIDDGWEAAERTPDGELLANEKFPGMKKLADDVHALGLKLGIYSGPGPLTCGGYLASYQHELQDAQTWARWGIDYLKYDWCAYSRIAKDRSLPELKKPYILMREMLNQVDRDIVYSLCQYGMGDVWTWGEEVGGNLWRTTGDITDTWTSMAGIGFRQDQCSPYAGPGHWNDPDMLVVGKVGWGPSLRETKLTPDEQYTHISLWCLLSAPLLLGCDMQQLDDFTLSLLTNDEVLAVNQDPLGKQATKLAEGDGYQVWGKPMSDGSTAIGIFNTGSDSPVEAFSWDGEPDLKKIRISWKELGLTNNEYKVRDLWRQQDLESFKEAYEAEVPHHGVVMVRVN